MKVSMRSWQEAKKDALRRAEYIRVQVLGGPINSPYFATQQEVQQ